MRLRLAAGFTVVAALIIVVFSVPLGSFVSRVERERLVTALERDAFMLAGHASETMTGSTITSLQPYIDDLGLRSDARVVVTDAAGRLVATNDPAETLGTDYSNRPEVTSALRGDPASGERRSVTLGQVLVYVAVPVIDGESVAGAVRLSYPKSVVDGKVRERMAGILGAGAVSLIAAVIVAVFVGSALSRPITRLRRVTDELSRGNFEVAADESGGPKELRDLAHGFNEMSRRLELIMRGQRQFAGDVSHQLRTPLTALRLRLEQAEAGVHGGADEAAEALEEAIKETDRLQGIIEQLLALARLEGRAAPRVSVDAVAVLRDRMQMWEPLADELDLELGLHVPDSARCLVVAGGLEQIVDNFVDNAVSVAPAGSRITVRLVAIGDSVTISVEDHGPGLTDEQRARAFERFWRGPGASGESGSGLGLAVVKQIATASGGDAWLTATPGGGVTACASFPRE